MFFSVLDENIGDGSRQPHVAPDLPGWKAVCAAQHHSPTVLPDCMPCHAAWCPGSLQQQHVAPRHCAQGPLEKLQAGTCDALCLWKVQNVVSVHLKGRQFPDPEAAAAAMRALAASYAGARTCLESTAGRPGTQVAGSLRCNSSSSSSSHADSGSAGITSGSSKGRGSKSTLRNYT